jgi:hypothetical protein
MIQLLIFLIVGMSGVYLAVALYSRSVRREKLERDWDENPRPGQERADFIREGLRAYEHSFRRHMIVLVYVVPIVAIGVILYVVNFM